MVIQRSDGCSRLTFSSKPDNPCVNDSEHAMGQFAARGGVRIDWLRPEPILGLVAIRAEREL